MSLREEIERANSSAVERMMESRPLWVGVERAGKKIPGMEGMTLLHAGPPLEWERASGPVRGALIGAVLFEGWASKPEEAEKLLARGEVRLSPTHDHNTVAPMAGVVSPSMPVIVVRDPAHGVEAYSNLNEGIGRVLRYGAYSQDVIERLHWMSGELAEALAAAVKASGEGVDLKRIIAQALHMGDECHNRHYAATALLAQELGILLLEAGVSRDVARRVLEFVRDNRFFFLNYAMAAAKAMTMAAHGVRLSTIVTTISRNGTEVGIRVSGLGNSWFTAPAPIPRGVFFPGHSQEEANPDLGDSAITETAGFGGFAMAAAPAVVSWVGGSVELALEITRKMYEITFARHRYFTIPYLGFQGTPTGVDVRKVVKSGIEPTINTGIASKKPGVGQIGAGMVSIPGQVFKDALRTFAQAYGV